MIDASASGGSAAFCDVVVDTETTGLGHRARPARPDGVIQVGYAWRPPNGTVETWSSLCNPGQHLLASGRARGALEVNGRTEAEILAADPTEVAARVLHEQLSAIAATSGKQVRLLAYNRDFDQPFLAAKPWTLGSFSWGPCIMLAASKAINGPFGRYLRLGDAVAALGLDWPGSTQHDAAHDAHAALLVAETLASGGR